MLSDDGSAEVEIDKAGGGKLGTTRREGGGEGALVVVVAVGMGIVFAADVDNSVAC